MKSKPDSHGSSEPAFDLDLAGMWFYNCSTAAAFAV
jgi:hypothetical protein